MKRNIAIAGVVIVAAVTVVQWTGIAGRLAQLKHYHWKFQEHATELADFAITAGTTALLCFLLATVAAIVWGVTAQGALAPRDVVLRRVNVACIALLCTGAFLWVGLIASPLVELHWR